MYKFIMLCLIVVLCFSMVACGEKEQTPPDIIGLVQELTENSVLIDSTGEGVKGLIWVTIEDDTKFSKDVSETFEVGNYVECLSIGMIMESYPMQTSAKEIQKNEK